MCEEIRVSKIRRNTAEKMRFKIRDREAGNIISEFKTREEAEKELAAYEAADKADGTYTYEFYEIVEEE